MKKQIFFLLSLLAFCFLAAVSVVVVNTSTSCEAQQEIAPAPMNDFLSPGMPNYFLL